MPCETAVSTGCTCVAALAIAGTSMDIIIFNMRTCFEADTSFWYIKSEPVHTDVVTHLPPGYQSRFVETSIICSVSYLAGNAIEDNR